MKTVEDLRQRCRDLETEGREAVKKTIEYWIETKIISKHKPWRAVIGNRRCKPVPIHRDFYFDTKRDIDNNNIEDKYGWLLWPNLDDEEIRRYITDLGFVIGDRSQHLAISVPAPKKGEPLTFAQECVKRINDQYSLYVAAEKRKAKVVEEDFIAELYNTPSDKIRRAENCTIFLDFVYSKPISKECARFCNRYLKQDGIVSYLDEKGDCVGVAVMDEN